MGESTTFGGVDLLCWGESVLDLVGRGFRMLRLWGVS